MLKEDLIIDGKRKLGRRDFFLKIVCMNTYI